MMIAAAIRTGLVLASSFVVLSSALGYSLKTNSMIATFSGDGVLVRLESRLTGEVMRLDAASQFAFQTESEEISDRNCRRVAVRSTPGGLEVSYAHPQFEVSVAYRAQEDDHFIEKNVRLRHVGDAEFAIKRFSLGRWVVGGPGMLVPFPHGQCVTYFLRQSKGGLFFGVRTPFQELVPPDTELLDLAYPVNLVFAKGSAYEAEAAYWGVGKDNRVIAQGWSRFPESDRARVRFWLDWARRHPEYMNDVIDLPDWPSSGKPDGYLRVRNGAGFAFLFNASNSEQTISIPLDGEAKLDDRRRYRLEQLHPASGPTVTAQSSALWNLPSHSALLIAIQPVQ